MDSFYDLLQRIKQNPATYIGKHSVFTLQAFLDGYSLARRDLNLPLSDQEQEFQDFLQWMRSRFDIKPGQSWASVLLCQSTNERDAVEQFFVLFKEFLHQKTLGELESTGMR